MLATILRPAFKRIVAKAMMQDPLESLSKVSIPYVIPVKQMQCICANYREAAENPPCISQVPFVPSTTGKKYSLSKLLRVRGSHMASKPRVAKTLSVAPFFFFCSKPPFSVRTHARAGWLVWDRLFLPIPQSCPFRAVGPLVCPFQAAGTLVCPFRAAGPLVRHRREKRALCE